MGDFFVRRGHVLGERYLEILGDPLEFHFFHDVDEGNDHTGGSGTPGASRPVDVGFPVVRRLVEEHMGEFGNVNAACGHVRGDEEPDGAFAQPGKDIFAAALGQSADNSSALNPKPCNTAVTKCTVALVLQKMMAEAGFSTSRILISVRSFSMLLHSQ